jgi:hypothetical protein
MKNILKYISFIFFTATFIISCSCDDCDHDSDMNSGTNSGTNSITGINPNAPTLVAPSSNNSCEIGKKISATISEVTFSWAANANTKSYTLSYTNLSTNVTTNKSLLTTSTTAFLSRGAVYTWRVTAHNIIPSKTATSESRKFYLSAEPIVNNIPLAAVLKTPSLNAGIANFSWEGSDPDAGDTLSYTVYVDKVDGKQTPNSALTNLSAKTASATLEAGSIYFWRVKTTDQNKNSSFSLISTFTVN